MMDLIGRIILNFIKSIIIGFFVGIGSWLIGSPILGSIFGYAVGGVIGTFIGCVVYGGYLSIKIFEDYTPWILPISTIVLFIIVIATQAIIYFKKSVDNIFGMITDGHFVISYIIVYILISFVVILIIETIVNPDNY